MWNRKPPDLSRIIVPLKQVEVFNYRVVQTWLQDNAANSRRSRPETDGSRCRRVSARSLRVRRDAVDYFWPTDGLCSLGIPFCWLLLGYVGRTRLNAGESNGPVLLLSKKHRAQVNPKPD